jgi:4a-hydroxytetrahydrobiopterin dehydratase
VDEVAELAESVDHHPDIDIRWRRVRLLLTTKASKGLTAKDFALASRIDDLSKRMGAE